MRATVARPGDLGQAEVALWSSFAAASALGNPFLSHGFARAVGANRDDARVAVLHDGPAICAFFAFQAGPDGRGEPIGATICDAQAVLARPGWDFDAPALVATAGLSSWRFDHLVATQGAFEPFHTRRHRSPVVDLSAGHGAFLDEVRRHSRDLLAQVARRRRRLEHEIGPVSWEWQSPRPHDDLALLERWKSAQYRRTGTWDRFARPWIGGTLARLVDEQPGDCAAVLSALRAGDRTAAVHLGLLGPDRLCWWFPAYDPDLGRYSPGLILLLELVAEAAGRGIGLVDLGRGEHGYKLRVTRRADEVAEGEVPARVRPNQTPSRAVRR